MLLKTAKATLDNAFVLSETAKSQKTVRFRPNVGNTKEERLVVLSTLSSPTDSLDNCRLAHSQRPTLREMRR